MQDRQGPTVGSEGDGAPSVQYITTLRIVCDRCDTGEASFYSGSNPEEATRGALCDGWLIADDGALCAECAN